jgi:hypothetical protein
MQLRTYTGLWNVEKRIYKFYDVALPYPVSVRQIGTLLATAIPWLLLTNLLRVPWESPWFLIHLAPPVGFMIYANRPVADGKNLVDFLSSQARFFLRPRIWAALAPIDDLESKSVRLRAAAWRRDK